MVLRAMTATTLVLLLSAASAGAEPTAVVSARPAAVRSERPNLVTVELFGRGVAYTVNYERYLNRYLSLGIGAGGLGGFGAGYGLMLGYVSFNPVGDTHSLHVSLGAGVVGGTIDFIGDYSGAYGTFTLGYQLQARSGFVFRVGVNALVAKGDSVSKRVEFLVWPGIQFGGSF